MPKKFNKNKEVKSSKAAGKAPKKKAKTQKPTYLREIRILFKKKRVKAGSPVGKSITNAQQIYELFSDLQNEVKEKLVTVSLDSKMKILCFEVVAIGSLNSIYARPIEAIRASIPLNPYGIIIVHNYPSGGPKPSKDDKSFTSDLLINTKSLGVKFYDHIIIGDGEYYSFAEHRLMDRL